MNVWLALVVGSLGVWAGMRTMAINDLLYAISTTAAATLFAGFLAGRRGVLVGFGSFLAASLIWTAEVLTRAWLSGELAATSPDCDPCGLGGYVVRMLIVTAIGLSTFGVLGGAAGWLGELVRHRVRPPSRELRQS